jgi:hypothetical protein
VIKCDNEISVTQKSFANRSSSMPESLELRCGTAGNDPVKKINNKKTNFNFRPMTSET